MNVREPATPPGAGPGATERGAKEAPCDEACDADQEHGPAEGSGAFLLGAGVFDVSSLNDRLAAHGFEHLSSLMAVIGGEGHAVLRSGLVIGARGAAFLGPDDANGPGGMRAGLSGGFGMIDFGFAPVHTQAVLFTVTGGLGGYGLNLKLSDGRSVRFDDVLADPKRGSSLSRGGLLVGLTLGIDGRIPVGRAEHRQQGFFTLGARVGGLFGPALGSWRTSDGESATDGPKGVLTGAYAAIAVGFGGGRMREESARK